MDTPALSRRPHPRSTRSRAVAHSLQDLLDLGGWSAPSLARAACVSPNTVYSAVRGIRCPWDQTVEALASALQLPTGIVRAAWAVSYRRGRR
jgi:hypothetical protein